MFLDALFIRFQMSTSRVVVIVGASSGIGAGLARYLSNEAKSRQSQLALVLVARQERELNQVADNVRHGHCSALAIPCDVTKRVNVEKILEDVKNHVGSISMLGEQCRLGHITIRARSHR